MPLSTLDPNAALIVIDLQKGVLEIDTVHPARDVLDRSARLVEAFRAAGRAVVLVNATGRAPGRNEAAGTAPATLPSADWADLAAELGTSDRDLLVSKQRWGAFLGTDLDQRLRDLGVTQVLISGIATSAGVESTARSAHDLGYHVVLVTDAMTDRTEELHTHSVERIFPRLGETTTTDEVLAALG